MITFIHLRTYQRIMIEYRETRISITFEIYDVILLNRKNIVDFATICFYLFSNRESFSIYIIRRLCMTKIETYLMTKLTNCSKR